MIQQVLSFVKKHHMIEKGEHILAAVSGGADSVCLLLMLEELRRHYDCQITVVHVEHGIRGISSLADAAFVKALCEGKGIKYKIFHCDAIAFSEKNGMSLEEGARELRYQYFEQTRQEIGADKIAVAHNQNDSAETLLFHLARGTGLKGMCGIAPVRDNIIRPLLCVDRKCIEAYLEEQGQKYCIDITNQETEYSRNKIRHQVLPVLEEINTQAVAHLYRSTEYVAEALMLMEELVQQARSAWVTEENVTVMSVGNEEEKHVVQQKRFLIKDTLEKQLVSVQKMLILGLLGECAGSEKDISDVHVSQVINLFSSQVGKYVMLPYHMEARRTYEGVVIQKNAYEKPQKKEIGQNIEDGCKLMVSGHDWTLSARVLEKNGKNYQIPKKTYTKWFDYDKIKGALLLRNRCQGDYITVDSQGRTQSLKKYFINEKVPAQERDMIPLVADGAHILWVVGYRISEAYKVTTDTKRILEIQINGGDIYE